METRVRQAHSQANVQAICTLLPFLTSLLHILHRTQETLVEVYVHECTTCNAVKVKNRISLKRASA